MERNRALVDMFCLSLQQSPLLKLHFLAYLARSLTSRLCFYFEIVSDWFDGLAIDKAESTGSEITVSFSR